MRSSLPGNELCVCEEHAAFKGGKRSRGGEQREEGKGGGELRLRSTRGKAFGCCSKLSSPQWAGREKECGVGGMVVVGGLKGNRLAREIEKGCEGMYGERLIEGVKEQKQWSEIVQAADRGSWQTGATLSPTNSSVA